MASQQDMKDMREMAHQIAAAYGVEEPAVSWFSHSQSKLTSKSGKSSTLLGYYVTAGNSILINDGLTYTQMMDTLLHEMAHCIAWQTERVTGHGRRWRRIARQLGTNPRANQAHNPLFNNS